CVRHRGGDRASGHRAAARGPGHPALERPAGDVRALLRPCRAGLHRRGLRARPRPRPADPGAERPSGAGHPDRQRQRPAAPPAPGGGLARWPRPAGDLGRARGLRPRRVPHPWLAPAGLTRPSAAAELNAGRPTSLENAMRALKPLLLSAALVTGLAGCATTTSPTGRTQYVGAVSQAELDQLGARAFNELRGTKQLAAASQQSYVRCVVDAVVGQLPASYRSIGWESAVFTDDDTNAFALPGGKVGVYTGIFKAARNQDQLAGVIAHEI